jgi:hypothetical protein
MLHPKLIRETAVLIHAISVRNVRRKAKFVTDGMIRSIWLVKLRLKSGEVLKSNKP